MSRFISGGTYTEDDNDASSSTQKDANNSNEASLQSLAQKSSRDEAWLDAQRKIDATKRSSALSGSGAGGGGGQEGGKTLYEVLQANKAAKQEAHEANLKLSNQFRSLDEDEVAFLDSVDASSRAREEAEKRETKEQLETFRRLQQQSGSGGGVTGPGDGDGDPKREVDAGDGEAVEEWRVGGAGAARRKRKRGGAGIAGVKLRKTSTSSTAVAGGGEGSDHRGNEAEGKVGAVQTTTPSEQRKEQRKDGKTGARSDPLGEEVGVKSVSQQQRSVSEVDTSKTQTQTKAPAPSPSTAALGLAAYSSSDED